MSISNAKAVMEAMLGRKSEFVRTPKFGDTDESYEDRKPAGRGKRKCDVVPYIEALMGVYMTVCAVVSVFRSRVALTTPFLVIFAFGFFYVSILSFQGQWAGQRARKAAEARRAPATEEARVE
jgi:hypothetical protein